MTHSPVKETEIIRAVASFLIHRGALPYRFSVPRGKGMNTGETTDYLRQWFGKAGFEPEFSSQGADVEALSDTEWWRIECKGIGSGKSPTHRNNFDRALASVVTYFEEPPYPLGEKNQNVQLCLGLAVPTSPTFLHQINRRVRSPLRKRLNLWILLCEQPSGVVKAVSPSENC